MALNEHIAAHVAELFRAFSDTSRVRILAELTDKELNVSTIAKMMDISESAVSHHLRGLRQLRVVSARREGKEVYYSIEDDHLVTLLRQGIKHVQDR